MMAFDAGCDGVPMLQNIRKERLVYTEVSCHNAGHAGSQLEPEGWKQKVLRSRLPLALDGEGADDVK